MSSANPVAGPLAWLSGTLQAQDEARLDELWRRAGNNPSLLQRCVDCFARRYPDAPAAAMHRRRLRELRGRRFHLASTTKCGRPSRSIVTSGRIVTSG